jgi:hypothetical protein
VSGRVRAAGETGVEASDVTDRCSPHAADGDCRSRPSASDLGRAEIDVNRAEARAEGAEDDALFAIDYAYVTIEEAESAVLDAIVARNDANELAAR